MRFDYSSIGGGVEAGAVVTQSSVYNNGVTTSFTKTLTAAEISGTSASGSITYIFCAAFGAATSVTTTISIQTITGVSSNTIAATTPKPVGAFQRVGNPTWEQA